MSKAAVVGIEGTPGDLLRFQRQAWSNIVFSVTQRCPLRCRHCVTSSAPVLSLPLLGAAAADRWADELPTLAAMGLRHVSFTGGEPTLALAPIARLAAAAKAASLVVSVTTAGSWARSERQAARVVDALGAHVDSWDFGYDRFHAEHLEAGDFLRAVNAVLPQAGEVAVRICDDGTPATAGLVAMLEAGIEGPAALIVQPVYAIGRGDEIIDGHGERGGPDLDLPCMATGLFVREDGSTGPCCAALSYGAAGRHPFDYGSAARDGLVTVWRRWREDQLLRLIRLAGFRLPLRWLAEAGLVPDAALAMTHVCELCERLWDADGRAAAILRERAADPALRPLLDRLETELYGDVWSEGGARPADRVPATVGG